MVRGLSFFFLSISYDTQKTASKRRERTKKMKKDQISLKRKEKKTKQTIRSSIGRDPLPNAAEWNVMENPP
jgi:hypothetical protein